MKDLFKPPTSQTIRCPNCGSFAERHYVSSQQLIRTQCSDCDYLMVTCAHTGNVIEAYAPGIPAPQWVGVPEITREITLMTVRSNR